MDWTPADTLAQAAVYLAQDGSRGDQNADAWSVSTSFPGLPDDDLNFLIERVEETEEAVGGKSFEPSVEQRGDPGLVGAEQVRRFLLGQLAFQKEVANPIGDLGLGVEFFRVRQFQILENILSALADGFVSFHAVSLFCFSIHSR